MKDRVLADTCIWIEFFNPDSLVGKALEQLIVSDSVVTCGIVLFELMQGIKSEKEKAVITNSISNLPYIEMDLQLWEKAAVISSSLKKKGIILPVSDILIAAIALKHKLPVFTLDKHFESISGITIYKP